LTEQFKLAEKSLDEKFEQAFELKEKGFNDKQISFGKMLIGNMLGGLGYFYGTSLEDRARQGIDEEEIRESLESFEDEDDYFSEETKVHREIPAQNPKPAGPFSLFTGVPSRPFFPRGFLWDSGFDHHLIEVFDTQVSLEIIKNWVTLIDKDGWLPREQILGDEARSKVPSEFQVQYPDYANPPTLVTALEKQLDFAELATASGISVAFS
jgi:mannosyl-oligosaccharide glucosidase